MAALPKDGDRSSRAPGELRFIVQQKKSIDPKLVASKYVDSVSNEYKNFTAVNPAFKACKEEDSSKICEYVDLSTLKASMENPTLGLKELVKIEPAAPTGQQHNHNLRVLAVLEEILKSLNEKPMPIYENVRLKLWNSVCITAAAMSIAMSICYLSMKASQTLDDIKLDLRAAIQAWDSSGLSD